MVHYRCCDNYGRHRKRCKQRNVRYSEEVSVELDSPLARDVKEKFSEEAKGSDSENESPVQVAKPATDDTSPREGELPGDPCFDLAKRRAWLPLDGRAFKEPPPELEVRKFEFGMSFG